MTSEELRAIWKKEEDCAFIEGWDFSHIHGRYEEGNLPWDYDAIARSVLKDDMKLLDYNKIFLFSSIFSLYFHHKTVIFYIRSG